MFRRRCTVSSTFSKVHDYFVGDSIGSGFFSAIHAGFSTKTKNTFAIKILNKEQIIRYPRGDRILFNESVLAPLLDHPHIVKIQEIIDSQQQLFQVMQYATNRDLLTYLRQNELEPAAILKMMDQLLSAVEYLHMHGICHRDIKLENILLMENNSPRLSDFGLASVPFSYQLRNHCGSKGYVSPEAISAPSFDGYKADMWSLGVVFYILFTRSMPFQEDNMDFDGQIQNLDFSKIPHEVQQLILALWAKNPEDRPSALQCRGLPMFSRIQNRVPPTGPIQWSIENPRETLGDVVLSRISQVLEIPMFTFLERISQDAPRAEKLLCILLMRRYEKMSAPNPEFVFKLPFSHTSQPVRNAPLIQRHGFSTSSSNIVSELNKFLLSKSCCITSPLSLERSIVMNTTTGDAKIDFDCAEAEKAGNCTLVLTADNKQSCPLMRELIEHLQKRFREDLTVI